MSDETDHQELLMLYQTTTTDLSYFKTQQWSVSTYAFLLYAGIAGMSELDEGVRSTFNSALLLFLVLLIASAALIVLKKLQDSIGVRQARLEAARSSLGQKFQAAWNAKEKKNEYIPSYWFLNIAVLLGAVILKYYVLK